MSRVAAVVLPLLLVLPAVAAGPGAEANVLRGSVVETLAAGSYTYVRLKTASGTEWAAVEKVDLKTGTEAAVGVSAVMQDFESPLLKRRFPKVAFGILLSPRPKEAAHAAHHAPGHGGGEAAAPAPGLKALPRPAGPAQSVTVADLYARRKALAGKLVRVTGKVVKTNANILGRTWLHLRDGSGSAKKGDEDLTATTRGSAAVGDQVSAEGVVSLDKDLGSGYAFPVLLEDATLSKPAR